MKTYNRNYSRRCWRESFGSGQFKRRIKKKVNWNGEILVAGSYRDWRDGEKE